MVGQLEFVLIDVFFILLLMILFLLVQIFIFGGEVVVLIKFQFEVGKEYVGKYGIICECKVYEEVLMWVLFFMVVDGFDVLGLDYLLIKGG